MENPKSKLDIYIDPSFLVRFFNNEYINDDEVHFKSSFKREVLNVDANNVSFINGKVISKEEFNKMITGLDSQKHFVPKTAVTKKQTSSNQPIDFHYISKINNPSSIFLTNLKDEEVEKCKKKTGYLFFNATKKNWFENYRRLSFECKFTTTIEIKPEHEEPKPFDFKEFSEYSLPTNSLLLIDPYMATWPIKKIKQNIFRLFKSLFFKYENDAINRIRIISLYDKHPSEKYKPAKPKDIKKEFINYFNSFRIDIEVIYVKKYLFYDYDKDGNKKKNIHEINKIEDLYTICDEKLHDRLIISNYLYYQSGRSFDTNMKYNKNTGEYVLTKYSSVDLFSILNRPKFEQIITYFNVYNKLHELNKREENNRFFEF